MLIRGRKIGPGQPPFVVGEISCNHGGSLDKCILLMGIGIGAGADAVKVQCYTPDSLTLDCNKRDFILQDGPWAGRSLYDLYQSAHTPLEWMPTLFQAAKDYNTTLFASVFDEKGLELLESLDCPAYKIASMEVVDIPLIQKVVATGKPIIISTGMATQDEIFAAKWAAVSVPNALLHCVSGYPTKPENANLMRMKNLGTKMYGISDHTLGWEIPVAATALGASIIEKHICVSREDKIEDATFSLEPEEFKVMCEKVKATWQALQEPKDTQDEDQSRPLRRSLYVTEPVKKGEAFTNENIRSIRPAYGLPPKELPQVLGKLSACDIERGTALAKDMIQSEGHGASICLKE